MFLILATLLITVIAANILIQHTSELENDVFVKVHKAETASSNGITVLSVAAENGVNGSVDKFIMTIRISPGSDELPLENMLLGLRITNETRLLKYGGQGYTEMSELNLTHYAVEYVHESALHQEGKLINSEVANVKFKVPYNVSGGEELFVRFIPKTGTPTVKILYIPELVNTKRVQIYPQV